MSQDASAVLKQLEAPKRQMTLAIGKHELPVTNLDKPLWPGSGRRKPLTKRDLLRYFALVSPWMLPHLTARPIFVTRFPNGVTGKSFYQKHWEPVPPFARTITIYSSHGDQDGEYLLCENLPTLLWLGQMGGLELHAWFSRIEREPDARTKGRRFHGSEAALERSVLRTSGRTGLHLYLPIVRDLDFDGAREVAETIARTALQEHPREVTLEWSVERRKGKIFFDYNQNSRGKSLAVPYSPRRHPNGTVATPVTWEELETIYPTDFTLRTVPGRLETEGDPWAGILEQKQDLGAALAAGSGR